VFKNIGYPTNFADIQYYQYGYIGTDTNTNISAPLIQSNILLHIDIYTLIIKGDTTKNYIRTDIAMYICIYSQHLNV